MKHLILALSLTLAAGATFARATHAAAPAASDAAAATVASTQPGTPQRTKMKTCNADAKDKKGDERKAFMSECLKG